VDVLKPKSNSRRFKTTRDRDKCAHCQETAEHNYVKRKAQTKLATEQTENRHEQFENIERLKQEYRDAGNPIISIDTKKKSTLAICIEQGNSTQPKQERS